MSFPFVQNIKSENEQISALLSAPVFTVEKKLSKEEEKYLKQKQNEFWNKYNLIPTVESGFEEYQEIEHNIKMICYQTAQDCNLDYFDLFNNKSMLDVYELILNDRAFKW